MVFSRRLSPKITLNKVDHRNSVKTQENGTASHTGKQSDDISLDMEMRHRNWVPISSMRRWRTSFDVHAKVEGEPKGKIGVLGTEASGQQT